MINSSGRSLGNMRTTLKGGRPHTPLLGHPISRMPTPPSAGEDWGRSPSPGPCSCSTCSRPLFPLQSGGANGPEDTLTATSASPSALTLCVTSTRIHKPRHRHFSSELQRVSHGLSAPTRVFAEHRKRRRPRGSCVSFSQRQCAPTQQKAIPLFLFLSLLFK